VLRQAPRVWNSKLDTVLQELGFTKCKPEHGLYTRVKNNLKLIVGVYVNDLVIQEECDKEVNLFKREMKRVFCLSDLNPLS
jgi:hypothetical protein